LSFELPPRRSPGDVIRSAEWNKIIDALENLNARVEALEGGGPAAQSWIIIGAAMAGYIIDAGNSFSIQPFTADRGSSLGFTLSIGITFKKFVLHIQSNDLDGPTYFRAVHNEVDSFAEITVPAGETGTFTVDIADYTVPALDRVFFEVDTTASTFGSLDLVSISLLGVAVP